MDFLTIFTIIGWLGFIVMIGIAAFKNVRLPTISKKMHIAFWIPISVMLVTSVIPLINWVFGPYAVMTKYGQYFSHLWLYAIIYLYSSTIHLFLPGKFASYVNMGITVFFSIIVCLLMVYMESSMPLPFEYIYKLFDYLILSKHLSIFNGFIFGICSGVVYYFYTNSRYSKDGNKEQCDWHKTAFSPIQKTLILVFVGVFVLYPLLLSWRTYSLENTDLVHTKIPLLIFAIFMFGVFHDLFITGWFSSRKSESLAKDETDEDITKEQCEAVDRSDYFSSAGLNYIIWMCVGLISHSVVIAKSKNRAVQNREIAGPIDAITYFFSNLMLVISHGLGTIFGGTNLWRS